MTDAEIPPDHYRLPPVLDPCCGTKMMWFNHDDDRVIFGDIRYKNITVTDRSKGNSTGTRCLKIEPDCLMDYRNLPYPNNTFYLVAFDPPHLKSAGPKSWLAAKYGKLSDEWRADLARGFSECFRVLRPNSTLIFKWNETQIPLREIISLSPHAPLFGQISGRKGMTHWLVFMKPEVAAHE